MLYTNYKQVARLTLKSDDAIKEQNGLKVVEGSSLQGISKYTFKVNLPFYKFIKNTKLAVESFSILGELLPPSVGDVFILNCKKSNVYHSTPSKKKGTCILSTVMGSSNVNYFNSDIINNSIDITGNTGFLEGDEIEIFVDTNIFDDGNIDIEGCLDVMKWSLTLVVYEEEKEENAKDFVDDRVKNFSKPSLY